MCKKSGFFVVVFFFPFLTKKYYNLLCTVILFKYCFSYEIYMSLVEGDCQDQPAYWLSLIHLCCQLKESFTGEEGVKGEQKP